MLHVIIRAVNSKMHRHKRRMGKGDGNFESVGKQFTSCNLILSIFYPCAKRYSTCGQAFWQIAFLCC
jgi:hypothetical protein